MEKFFMVIVFCIGAECQGIWQESTYNSMANCINASPMVKEYFMATFPESRGEIYWMDGIQFTEWRKWVEDGNSPEIIIPLEDPDSPRSFIPKSKNVPQGLN